MLNFNPGEIIYGYVSSIKPPKYKYLIVLLRHHSPEPASLQMNPLMAQYGKTETACHTFFKQAELSGAIPRQGSVSLFLLRLQ